MQGRLRGRRVGSGGELAERIGRVPEPELRCLAERIGEAVEIIAGAEPLDGGELTLCRTGRAYEVRVIRIRPSVRTAAYLGYDRSLLEREHGLRCAHEREERLDRLPALRVCDGMSLAVGQRERRALGSGKPSQQRRGLQRGHAQLDVWGATERERPGTEKRTAKIRRAAAASANNPARRSLEGCVPAVDDTGGCKNAKRALVAVDVQLVTRRGVERPPSIRSYLRANPAVAQERERAPGRCTASEIEMQSPVASSAKMQAPGRVEESRQLGTLIALALRGDGGELLANVLGCDHRTTPSSASSRRLTSSPVEP